MMISGPAFTPWNNVGGLRSPYSSSFAYSRLHNTLSLHSNEDSQSGSSTNDGPSGRAKGYEDKMDKTRLEHILFSGEQTGPLNVE